jgi:hypothetical protein
MVIADNRIEFATGWGRLYPYCLEWDGGVLETKRRVEFLHAIQ